MNDYGLEDSLMKEEKRLENFSPGSLERVRLNFQIEGKRKVIYRIWKIMVGYSKRDPDLKLDKVISPRQSF